MTAYFVMAKMDDGDAPFDSGLVKRTYPENFELVPGHVWLIVSEVTSSYQVAESLGLVAGGTEEASGMVVPARGYWGFADKEVWRLLLPDGRSDLADPSGVAGWWDRVRKLA